jgi:hypothetical protein
VFLLLCEGELIPLKTEKEIRRKIYDLLHKEYKSNNEFQHGFVDALGWVLE